MAEVKYVLLQLKIHTIKCLCVFRCPSQVLTLQGDYISSCVTVNGAAQLWITLGLILVPLAIISIGYNNTVLPKVTEIWEWSNFATKKLDRQTGFKQANRSVRRSEMIYYFLLIVLLLSIFFSS